MELSVKVMDKAETINSILMFQTDDTSLYWRKPLFQMYPFLDEKKGLRASWKNRKKYLMAAFSDFYKKTDTELTVKAAAYFKHWSVNKYNIVNVFTETFGLDCVTLFNDIKACVSLNPICPRDLRTKCFTVFYKSDENGFLETALHEIVHFIWFHIWNHHFKDDIQDYESPHIKWLLSEMVIDTFVRNTKIGEFFSADRRSKAAYPYFYSMTVKSNNILATLSELYKKSLNMTHFMEQAYNYCLDNELAIREQML